MIRLKRNMLRNKHIIFIVITVGFMAMVLLLFSHFDNKIVKHLIHKLDLSNYRVESYVIAKHINEPKFQNINQFICKSDKEKMSLITIDFKSKTPTELQTLFHKFVQNPLMGICPSLKRFGGVYQECCKYWDGHKFVCISEVMHDVENDKCLVYSFGVSEDWSFEKAMSDLGCQVLMFDPTVNYPAQVGKKVVFNKIGLSAKSDDEKSLYTLSSILQKYGHVNTKITYLKIDIEGYEVDGLLEWPDSGSLKHVQQLAMEFHLPDTETTLKFFYGLIRLYIDSDFRLISFDLNGCAGKAGESYSQYAEIVLMRPSEGSVCNENLVKT